MKKYLIVLLVLAMAAYASAGPVWLEVDDADEDTSYGGSDVITINLVSNEGIKSISIGRIDGLPTAQSINGLHTGFDQAPLQPGTIVNAGGVLISTINAGTQYTTPAIPAGQILWSFEYHVPYLPDSSWITIDDVTEGAVFTYIGGTDTPYIGDVDPLEIHVTPEPMTIALLGLGGLFLRRRK